MNKQKRRIDNINAEEMNHSWMQYSGPLESWFEYICEPLPRWEDDLKNGSILCWVWNGRDNNFDNPRVVSHYVKDNAYPYRFAGGSVSASAGVHATPVLSVDLYSGEGL